MDTKIEVTPDLPWFDGHFPGHPLLPGVVMLGWAIERADSLGLAAHALRRCARIKFQRPVLPGDNLDLNITARDQSAKFIFRTAGSPCASGTLSYVSTQSLTTSRLALPGDASPQPVGTRLPHAGRMRLLNRVLSIGGSTVWAESLLGIDHPFAFGEHCLSSVAIEMMAQCGALLGGPTPVRGMLISVREFHANRGLMSVTEPSTIQVEGETDQSTPLRQFSGALECGRFRASARFAVLLEEDS